jgi:phenylalanyl-tRNA synthetase alpha chain
MQNINSTFTLNNLQKSIQQIKDQLQAETTIDQNTHSKYLGKNGVFNSLAKQLLALDSQEKKEAGILLNELKDHLKNVISTKLSESSNQKTTQNGKNWVDLTEPGDKPKTANLHPISQAINEITHIFEKIGFTRVRYPEVDWDWYAFESLNMAPNHPARDEWETFFVDVPDTTKDIAYNPDSPRDRHPSLIGGKIVMTPHTSNGQVREMERLSSKPPIRMINISRCYRRQQDLTHTQMFHQFEGLVIDKNINIQHLKGTLDYFAREFYGAGTKSRIRPFHFQFTEPSFEVDFSCHICHGTGKLKRDSHSNLVQNDELESHSADKDQLENDSVGSFTKCRFCKSGWHEVGGAGMVHPNVLKAGNIDPEEYTGFAFGWGIERTYTLREGLNLDDIRLLYNGDMRFLSQF